MNGLETREKPDGRRGRTFDEARFFKGWLQRPLLMGAVSPSSRALGRRMADYVSDPAGFDASSVVLEFGPGTGVVTQCLIERDVPEEKLVLVEYSPEFCALLRSRFPRALVIEGDAYRPGRKLEHAIQSKRVESVVSSLPLFTKPDTLREAFVRFALSAMPAGSPFIQFSYAPALPVKPKRLQARLETSPWIKRNLPPARVLVYRRD